MTLRSRERSVVKDDLPAGERMVAMRRGKEKGSDAVRGSDPQVLVVDGCSNQQRPRNKKSGPLIRWTPITPPPTRTPPLLQIPGLPSHSQQMLLPDAAISFLQ